MKRKPAFPCATNPEVVGLSETLKIISDPNRLRILCTLFSGEKCVCEIEEGLGISQPLASHHLGVLREAGLAKVRKEGTWSYYSLDLGAMRELNEAWNKILGLEKNPMGHPRRDACCAASGSPRGHEGKKA